MNIEIVKQKYDHECGLCVLATIHNYFYPNYKISKNKLFEISNINTNGLSIYEMEILANKINLELESFNVSFENLIKENFNDFFITCFNDVKRKHFVICKIFKHHISVYETDGTVQKYSYKEFESIFLNIFIVVKKSLIFNDSIYQDNIEKIKNKFNYPKEYFYISLFVFIEIFSSLLNVISNAFIKVLIDSVIPMRMKQEIWMITLFFCTSYLLSFVMNYITSLIKQNKYEKIFKEHICFYTNILKNKNITFFDKFSKEIIHEYPAAISHMIIKKYFALPLFISDVIISIFLLFIILFNSYFFIIPIVLNSIMIILFGIIKYKHNAENYESLNINKNKIEINYNNFLNLILKEKNFNKLNNVEQSWHKEIWNYQYKNKKNTIFEMTLDLFDNSLSRIIFVSFVSFLTILILNDFNHLNIQISSLFFLTSIFNMLTGSLNDMFNYISSISFYRKNEMILNDFLVINNKELNDEGININKVKTIEFKNYYFSFSNKKIFNNLNITLHNGDLIFGKNGIGKTTLFKIISLFYLSNDKNDFYINGINLSKLNIYQLDKNIIYLPSDSTLIDIDFNSIMSKSIESKNLLIEFLRKTKINYKNNNLSKGEKQLLNMIALLNEKNKIILLDESCSNVNNKLNCFIYNDVKNILEENNFVLWISHNKQIKRFFKNNNIHIIE